MQTSTNNSSEEASNIVLFTGVAVLGFLALVFAARWILHLCNEIHPSSSSSTSSTTAISLPLYFHANSSSSSVTAVRCPQKHISCVKSFQPVLN